MFRKLLAGVQAQFPQAVIVWLGPSRLWRYSDDQIRGSDHLPAPAPILGNLRRAGNRISTFIHKLEKANVVRGQERTIFIRNIFYQMENDHIADQFGHLSVAGNKLIASRIEPLFNNGNNTCLI